MRVLLAVAISGFAPSNDTEFTFEAELLLEVQERPPTRGTQRDQLRAIGIEEPPALRAIGRGYLG